MSDDGSAPHSESASVGEGTSLHSEMTGDLFSDEPVLGPDSLRDPDISPELKERFPPVARVIERAGAGSSALLPVLHETQRIYGYLPPDSLDLISDALHVPRGQAQWVATVLVPFRFEPGPLHTVRICRGNSCSAHGGDEIERAVTEVLSELDPAEKSAAVEKLACMGCCSRAPNLMIDGKIHSTLTPEQARRLTADLLSKRSSDA